MGSKNRKKINIKIPNDIHIAWERDFSFLGTYLMAEQHLKELKHKLGVNYSMVAFFHKNNQIKFYRCQKDEKNEGKLLANKCLNDKNFINFLIENTKKYSDLINRFLKRERKLTKDNLNNFFDLLNNHFPLHHAIFWSADYLGRNNLNNKYSLLLKRLYSARKYNENVLPNVEIWLKKNDPDCLLLTPEECIDYKIKGKKVLKKILSNRNKPSFVYFDNNDSIIFTGKKALNYDAKFSKAILDKFNYKSDVIRGESAFTGICRGTVRVVIDFLDFKNIKRGEILVTPMTLPKYNQYIRKSKAIITDEGAILSHAAIFARENKIPCIIGTKIASKVLKDGDRVEVDADKGIIKII